jgi:hypothetical protein
MTQTHHALSYQVNFVSFFDEYRPQVYLYKGIKKISQLQHFGVDFCWE